MRATTAGARRGLCSAAGGDKAARASGQGRLGRVFTEMRTACREDVTAYAACIESGIEDVRKDKCAKEFAALKSCYARVLPKVS